MGIVRSFFGWIFILGGIYRVILGIGILFLGGILSSTDPITSSIEIDNPALLSVLGVVWILAGAFFIWLGSLIRGKKNQG